MENHSRNRQGSFDFVDRLIDLFHHPDAEPAPSADAPKLSSLNQQFENALGTLQQIIEQRKREMERSGSSGWKGTLKVEKEEVKKAREEKIQKLILDDIEQTHSSLQTGMGSNDLVRLREFLIKAAEIASTGEQSHEILPRCRFSILNRLHLEAGFLSLKELDTFLGQQGASWPVTVPRDPTLTPAEAQEVIKRNQAQRRKEYLNYSINKSSFLIVGIVEAWKSDYPEPGSALWNSVVLEAVATALRAKGVERFSQKLRHDRAFIENKASELLGEKVSELNQSIQEGVTSLSDAHRVVASSLKILDEIIPELAWEHLQKAFPELKGHA